ncbi:p21-activated protein kinase-interacting protein 1-like [Hydractinia symbiolongicarpus]|uniref:p21-activated protein kinase-interacting protein 1-like n=1 Tax=Hydractinia symbiolongicarpus TaxID=13093 RepID=UPI00254FCAB9|nr:p21-activated protein kinase-interacting protein 1-like [Hydractinia symbiolongicarpus]
MEIVVGTYNHVLFGFNFARNCEDGKEEWQFKPLFTDQGHTGCIKSVSTGGRYLASGSTDETIRLFDMKKHLELGTLVSQSGTITCIMFCGTSHMLSGSEDGTICIWKCKTWELEKTLKGHRGAIHSISLHPSGRLALSVSKDKTIKTWNLLTGRPAYTTSLKEVGELVRWSPTGDSYVVIVGCKLTVYKISGVDEPHVYRCEKYILTVEFVTDSILIIGGESDDVILYNFEKKVVLQRFAAHKTRTKALSIAPHPYEPNKFLLFTVASDGNLKGWCLNQQNLEEEPKLLAGLDIPGRPTCMTLKLSPAIKNPTEIDDTINVKSPSLSKKKKNADNLERQIDLKKKVRKKKTTSTGD